MEPYSVLMSIYYKEDSTYFKQSLESILSQTVRTDDLVLVCDGPLTPELDAVIEEYIQENPVVDTKKYKRKKTVKYSQPNL